MLIGILSLLVNTEGKGKDYSINRTTARLLFEKVFYQHFFWQHLVNKVLNMKINLVLYLNGRKTKIIVKY